MSEKIHSQPVSNHRTRARVAALVLAGASVASCAAEPAPVVPAFAEAHFSAACPPGNNPAIVEVAHSGLMPVDPQGERKTWGVVRLACFPDTKEAPVLTRDTEHGGACLGYDDKSHVVVKATQPGPQAPEFFAAGDGEIGVTGTSELDISKAQIHHHDLSDPYQAAQFTQTQCG